MIKDGPSLGGYSIRRLGMGGLRVRHSTGIGDRTLEDQLWYLENCLIESHGTAHVL